MRLLIPDIAAYFLQHLLAYIESQAHSTWIQLPSMLNFTERTEQLDNILLKNADALVLYPEVEW